MKITKTNFNGLIILEPTVYSDERGMFFETYVDRTLNDVLDEEIRFVQENQSISNIDVLRGLHYQFGDYAQSKLVKVAFGSVLDIALDLRLNSETYGKIFMETLSAENKKQVFIPKGFAHGFLSLSDKTIFQYKCDNYYNKFFESGINPLKLNIDWKNFVNIDNIIINERDKNFPIFMNQTLI